MGTAGQGCAHSWRPGWARLGTGVSRRDWTDVCACSLPHQEAKSGVMLGREFCTGVPSRGWRLGDGSGGFGQTLAHPSVQGVPGPAIHTTVGLCDMRLACPSDDIRIPGLPFEALYPNSSI